MPRGCGRRRGHPWLQGAGWRKDADQCTRNNRQTPGLNTMGLSCGRPRSAAGSGLARWQMNDFLPYPSVFCLGVSPKAHPSPNSPSRKLPLLRAARIFARLRQYKKYSIPSPKFFGTCVFFLDARHSCSLSLADPFLNGLLNSKVWVHS